MLLARDGTCKLADVGLVRCAGTSWRLLLYCLMCFRLPHPRMHDVSRQAARDPPASHAHPADVLPPSSDALVAMCVQARSLMSKAFLTSAGTMGTFAWSAPEVLTGQQVSTAAGERGAGGCMECGPEGSGCLALGLAVLMCSGPQAAPLNLLVAWPIPPPPIFIL